MFSEESNYIENVKKPENIAKNRVLEIIFSQFYPGDTIDNEDNICDIEENLPPAINPEVKPCRFPSYRTILKGVGGVILVMLVCAHLHGIALNKKSHNSFGETSSFDIRSLNDTPSDLMDTLEEIATNDFCEKDGVTIGDGKKGKKGKKGKGKKGKGKAKAAPPPKLEHIKKIHHICDTRSWFMNPDIITQMVAVRKTVPFHCTTGIREGHVPIMGIKLYRLKQNVKNDNICHRSLLKGENKSQLLSSYVYTPPASAEKPKGKGGKKDKKGKKGKKGKKKK